MTNENEHKILDAITHEVRIHQVDPDGRIHFSVTGPESDRSTMVSVVDSNTGLTVHRTGFTIRNGLVYWISTGSSNAARLRNARLRVENPARETIEVPFAMHGQSRNIVVDGRRIKLNHLGDDLFPIVCEIFFDKIYERDHTRISVGDVVVDVGANYGVFGLYSQIFKPKKVYCLEPVRSTFEHMRANLEPYGVVCVNKAVSWDNGIDTFAITEVNGNNYSKRHGNSMHSNWGELSPIREEEVETTNFNTFLAENGIDRIDFLKVDCEGGELSLFSTVDREFLRTRIGKTAIEYHTPEIRDTVTDILLDNGFEIEDTTGTEGVGLIYAYNKNF